MLSTNVSSHCSTSDLPTSQVRWENLSKYSVSDVSVGSTSCRNSKSFGATSASCVAAKRDTYGNQIRIVHERGVDKNSKILDEVPV